MYIVMVDELVFKEDFRGGVIFYKGKEVRRLFKEIDAAVHGATSPG